MNAIETRVVKTCSTCKVVKSLEDYHRNRSTKDGRVSMCKPCNIIKSQKYYRNNIELSRKKAREYRRKAWATNKEHQKKVRDAYRANNPERLREWQRRGHFKFQYGVTPEWVDARIKAQNSQCLLCDRKTDLVVDHNHNTKEVRGLICNPCNMFVGFIEKNEIILDKYKEYLKGE